MKKILFSLFCLMWMFGIVNAKTKIDFDWGRYALYDTHINDFNVYNDEVYYIGDSPYVNKLDKSGKPVYEKFMGSYGTIHLLNGQVMYIEDYGSSYYRYIYDSNMELIDALESTCIKSSPSMWGENDKYYFMGNCYYKKDTHEELTMEEMLSQNDLYDEYVEAQTNNSENLNELALQLIKEELSGTILPAYTFYEFNAQVKESWANYSIENFFVKENGDFSLLFYNAEKKIFLIELYNNDYEYLTTIELDSIMEPYVLYRNDRLFVLGYSEVTNSETAVNAVLTADEYLFDGKHVSSNNLVELIDVEEKYYTSYEPRIVTFAMNTSDGFVIVTEKNETDEGDLAPEIDDESEISAVEPAIFKFSLSYEIETKDNENGTIIVSKETSKEGEQITFKVEPKEGYKLDKVIVTDDAGNQIIVKDYTFTMPSSNVTIEAIFKVDNPNTSVFVSVVISCLLLLASYVFIVLKNKKVKQYE